MTACSSTPVAYFPVAYSTASPLPGARARLARAVLLSVIVHATLATSVTGGLSRQPAAPHGAVTLSARLAYRLPPIAAMPEAVHEPNEPLTIAPQRVAPRSAPQGSTHASRALTVRNPARGVAELPDGTYYAAKQLDVYPALSAPLDLLPPDRGDVRAIGRALLLLLIDEVGIVHEVSAVEAEPLGQDIEAAKRAFLSTRFTPAYRNGRPVKSRVLVEITYGKDRVE